MEREIPPTQERCLGFSAFHQPRPRWQKHMGSGEHDHRQGCQQPSKTCVRMGRMDAKPRGRRHAQGPRMPSPTFDKTCGKMAVKNLRALSRRQRASWPDTLWKHLLHYYLDKPTTGGTPTTRPSACAWFRDTTSMCRPKPSASSIWTTSTTSGRPTSTSMTNNHRMTIGAIPGAFELGSTHGQATHPSHGDLLFKLLLMNYKHLLHYHDGCQRKLQQRHVVERQHQDGEPMFSKSYVRPMFTKSNVRPMFTKSNVRQGCTSRRLELKHTSKTVP